MAATPAEDTDDLYGTPSANNTPAVTAHSATDYMDAPHRTTTLSQMAGIPGLGMLVSAGPQSAGPTSVGLPPAGLPSAEPFSAPLPAELVSLAPPSADQKPLDQPPEQPVSDAAENQAPEPLNQTTEQPVSDAAEHHHHAMPVAEDSSAVSVAQDAAAVSATDASSTSVLAPTSATLDVLGNTEAMTKNLPPAPKPSQDPEFLEAAKAQKGAEEAEWQYDSSDAESSSDDSSSDDSSEEDSDEEGYELLDPATAARMLMDEGANDDDDGPGKSNNQAQLRTKNEKPEEVIPRPDVTLTPEMKITPLGFVQHIVDNLILIRAFTTGEYQVLESGSVLCLENRDIIGAVQDTLGKVQEPLYSVAFTRPSDITDLAISEEIKIFYVNDHSTFVFTQPLKNLKGTDASNLHDEEVAEDEMEFSDDEAEAAYKKAKKDAKKGARAPHQQAHPPAAKPYSGGAMNYDDEPEGEDIYTPLARPENLQEMMVGGAPTLPPRRQFADRGRGGRGRGRGGDRGRGDRGRGGRGGRGGADTRKGPSHSYPDSHNGQAQNYAQQQLPQKPAAPQMWPQNQPQMNAAQFAFPQFAQQFPPPPPPPQTQAPFSTLPFAWPPQVPNPQQFFNNQQQQQQQQQQQAFQYPAAPPTPGGSIPAGAFVNPAFFQNMQQQQQQQAHLTPAAPAQNSGPSPEAIQAAQDLWRRLANQQKQ